MMKSIFWVAALLLIGAAWGLSIPLTKIAVSTGHQPLGLIFWQLVVAVLALGSISILRGSRLRLTRPMLLFCGIIAVLGTILPNSFSYVAAANLPAGIMAIVISLVPIFALPIATALKIEHPSFIRLIGVLLGAAAIIVLLAPSTALPGASASFFVMIALIAPLCYAIEDNFVSLKGTNGLDPMQVILGASLIGVVLAAPLALGFGQWIDITQPWTAAEYALLGSALLHAFAYTGYIWLIGHTGPVFSAMVAYIVTGSGVLWSMLLLGESYSGPVWLAFGLMIVAMTLVRPKHEAAKHSD